MSNIFNGPADCVIAGTGNNGFNIKGSNNCVQNNSSTNTPKPQNTTIPEHQNISTPEWVTPLWTTIVATVIATAISYIFYRYIWRRRKKIIGYIRQRLANHEIL